MAASTCTPGPKSASPPRKRSPRSSWHWCCSGCTWAGNAASRRKRGGRIIVVTSEGNGDLRHLVDHQRCVPAAAPLLSPLLTVIPLQLLAYHIAVRRGCDVDRPRNLAKSVTVE